MEVIAVYLKGNTSERMIPTTIVQAAIFRISLRYGTTTMRRSRREISSSGAAESESMALSGWLSTLSDTSNWFTDIMFSQ